MCELEPDNQLLSVLLLFSPPPPCFVILAQDIDHTYYTSKIYSPGDANSKELWVKRDDVWKVCTFLSSSYRQTEVGICHPLILVNKDILYINFEST